MREIGGRRGWRGNRLEESALSLEDCLWALCSTVEGNRRVERGGRRRRGWRGRRGVADGGGGEAGGRRVCWRNRRGVAEERKMLEGGGFVGGIGEVWQRRGRFLL
ncbi:unnamed protein product [Linum trigynum]|uniref:Uncharacterized protein n=1 Tax=Linum trigynum TaxID=586398 RepID=A0AAV2DAH0_9ROSI